MEIKINPEFKSLLPELSVEEKTALRESLQQYGCREPLLLWDGFILDGHNRYEICSDLGIMFNYEKIDLPDEEAAKDWIDQNQLARRNLSPDAFRLALGRRYNRTKKTMSEAGGVRIASDNLSKAHTAETLATDHGVNEKTVRRAGKFAEQVERSPELQQAIQQRVPVSKAIREARRETILANLEDISAKQAKETTGVYDVIVIDPPWPIKKIERDVAPNQSEFDYPTMDLEEITKIKIPAADSCHLWLWTTHKYLPDAMIICKAWGFKYVCTFVWHKPGGFQPFDLPQYNCEFALYGRKGSPIFTETKQFPVCFNAPRGAHSEKPQEFYDMVNRVTAGRRLDMFNRKPINGFDSWGNES